MKNIIFDMDGTLIDSSEAITNSVNFVRSQIGLPPIDKETVTKNINLPDADLPKIFYNTNEYREEHRELFRKHYHNECITNIKLYPGIKEVLEILSKDFTLSIATNASDFFAIKMLKYLKIENHFQTVLGRNNVENVKPHPEIVEKTLNLLNGKKENSLLIGDSEKDELTAKNAKIKFIFVEWGFGKSLFNPKSAREAKELIELIYESI